MSARVPQYCDDHIILGEGVSYLLKVLKYDNLSQTEIPQILLGIWFKGLNVYLPKIFK